MGKVWEGIEGRVDGMRGNMDISLGWSHWSELLNCYLLTEHGWKGTGVNKTWHQGIHARVNFFGVWRSRVIFIKAYRLKTP